MLSFHSQATRWSRVLVCSSCNHHVIKYPYVPVVKLDEALGLGIFASSKFLTLVYQTRFQFHASDVSLILSASSNKPSFGTRILSPAEVHGLSEASPYWICTFANNQHNLEDIKQFEHVWACLSSCLSSCLSIFRITSLSPMLLMFQVPCGTGVRDARSSTPRTCWTLPSSAPSWAPAAWAPWCWWVATSLSNVTSFAVFPSRKTHSYNMLQYVTMNL